MAVFSTIALATAAGASVIGSAANAIQGARSQRKALDAQQRAQEEALAVAMSERRREEAAIARAAERQPDVTAMLQAERDAVAQSTLLTRPEQRRRPDAPNQLLGE